MVSEGAVTEVCMTMSIASRFLLTAFAAAVFAVIPQTGAGSTPIAPKWHTTSIILCPSGFVYRCNQYGCFCVRG